MEAAERKNVEARAIDTLLDTPMIFDVPINAEVKRPPSYVALWNKLFPSLAISWRYLPKTWQVSVCEINGTKRYVRHLQISPLYLGTIDQIRRLYLQIDFDEKVLQQDPIAESRRLFQYIDQMSEIAALATLNTPFKNTKAYQRTLNRLKKFYKDNLTPKLLFKLISFIVLMSNQADFTNSIRLIQQSTATHPKAGLIE